MNTNEIVAMHEAGHVFALAAAKIYSELTSVNLGWAQYEGQPVLGLTIRDGRSLTDFSQRLRDMSERLTNGISTPSEYAEFMINNAVDCCFPHICYFAGGYAIENCWNSHDSSVDSRAAIDKRQIREMVLPAMGLANVSEALFGSLWNWGVGLVKDTIVQNEKAAMRLAGNIFKFGQCGVLDRSTIDAFFAADAQEIARVTNFENWSKLVKENYADAFRKTNQQMFNS